MAISPKNNLMRDHKSGKRKKLKCMDSEFRFWCPEYVPAKENDDFCSPCDCPEQIPQPKYPSSNSSFSQRKLVEIKGCIENANELLLALAEEDDINERALQLNLRKLRNLSVTIKLNCGEKTDKVSGCFLDAGKNFVILENSQTGNILLVLTERILSIDSSPSRGASLQTQELISIDPCLRRKLTFQFSEAVSRSPYLFNLFFGMNIDMFLDCYIGYYCYVKTDKDEQELEGTLVGIKESYIELSEYGEKQAIDFDTICFLELEK